MPSAPARTIGLDGVLVVGGGYAGLHAARAVADRGVHVTVVDVDGRHDFVTRLAAVAGRTASRRDASTAIKSFGHDVIVGTVAGVADGSVRLTDGRDVTAGAVVLCMGSQATQPGVPGIEHAHVLRTADDALELRATLEDAEAVTIIGGGATGVQLAGAISASEIVETVRLVEAEDRLLASMSEASSEGAARILRDRDVEVLTSATVERITPRGVRVDGGVLRGVTVWAGGFAPRTDGLALPLDDAGRVVVDEMLLVDGMDRTFAAGDVAAHLDPDGDPLPMSAQIAVQAGEGAGKNAARLVAGRNLRRVELTHQGWVLDLSGHRGVAEVAGISLAAPFADLIPPFLHEVIDVKTRFGIGGFGALTN